MSKFSQSDDTGDGLKFVHFFPVFPSPSIKKEWDDACKTADVKKSALKQKFEELAAK
jgi:hypothetical protein